MMPTFRDIEFDDWYEEEFARLVGFEDYEVPTLEEMEAFVWGDA